MATPTQPKTHVERYLAEYLAAQRKANFADFKGGTVTGTLPLTDALLNEVIGQTVLKEQAEKVRALTIEFRDNNIIYVQATVKVVFAWPTINLAAQVENLRARDGAPVLRLQLVPLGGLLETFLPVLLGLLPFPESVMVSGRTVDINLHTVFTRRGMPEFAALLKLLQVRVRRGLLEVDFGLKVD